jgi:serine/threonine protein kinase
MSELPETIGPYRVLERLGAGGMGDVFLAHDDRLDRRVAIKRMRLETAGAPGHRERFQREARVAARLSHPAVVQVYDVLAEDGADFIVMEHVEGTTLRQRLAAGPLPVAKAVALARDVAGGLAEIHRAGVVHRDLKSENVLITLSGHAKIADFGIAKRLHGEDAKDSLTAMGRVLGTYRSMSPEQACGAEVDHRSDLFSLGVLLYEALTGLSPFRAENELAMLNRIVLHRQAPVQELNPAVPEELSLLVDHLLEKDPWLRPQSAAEVAWALGKLAGARADETAMQTLPEPAAPAAPKLPATPESRGVPRALVWGLLVLMLATLLADFGREAESRALYRYALGILARAFGPAHPCFLACQACWTPTSLRSPT